MAEQTFQFGDYELRQVVTAPPYYENCYVVHHRPTASTMIVDPGASPREILAAADRMGGTVTAILLTHGHPDHVAGLQQVADGTKAPVYAHQNEQVILDAAAEWGMALLRTALTVPPVTYFADQAVLDLAGGVKVVATPGHTPGGVCYSFPGFALTGDTLFDHGFGRTDFPGGNTAHLRASITTLLDEVVPEDQLFSGHGGPWAASVARAWWHNGGAAMLG
ncbi:MBL fold metallo-hydrolase [Insolitispirillum peregrinum]|uniref:MBL fold metallo-hydrolase n=1 Tax=Insolitispirillum peregrinum TaxID=80876 RepID=UPI00360C1EE8